MRISTINPIKHRQNSEDIREAAYTQFRRANEQAPRLAKDVEKIAAYVQAFKKMIKALRIRKMDQQIAKIEKDLKSFYQEYESMNKLHNELVYELESDKAILERSNNARILSHKIFYLNTILKDLAIDCKKLSLDTEINIANQIQYQIYKEIERIRKSINDYTKEEKSKSEAKILFLTGLQQNINANASKLIEAKFSGAVGLSLTSTHDVIQSAITSKEGVIALLTDYKTGSTTSARVTFGQAKLRRENHNKNKWLHWLFKPFKSENSATEEFVMGLLPKTKLY